MTTTISGPDDDAELLPPEPPLGDQILADTRLSDAEAFAAAAKAYAAEA